MVVGIVSSASATHKISPGWVCRGVCFTGTRAVKQALQKHKAQAADETRVVSGKCVFGWVTLL
jgi:hypothetical protein